jgi:hypothetical protein
VERPLEGRRMGDTKEAIRRPCRAFLMPLKGTRL